MMVMVVVFVVKMVFTMMVMGTSVHGRAAAAHFVVVYGCGRAPRTTWYQKGVAARSSNLVLRRRGPVLGPLGAQEAKIRHANRP